MMKVKNFFIVLFFLFEVSCTKPKLTIIQKYYKALEFYSKGEYSDALELFKAVIIPLKGKIEGSEALYYLGKCYYEKNDYSKALNVFAEFFDSYPQDERSEEILYLHIICLYKQSRHYNLEQSATYDALEVIQQYISLYAHGVYFDEILVYKGELETKLQDKMFYQMKVFFDMQRYESALIDCENILAQYPETYHKDKILAIMVICLYNIVKENIGKEISCFNDVEGRYWIAFYNYYKLVEDRALLSIIPEEIKTFFQKHF